MFDFIQPQRPRATRAYGDENAVPNVGLQKSILQRHKSSPALSSVANNGGLKAAAKRTAFGDVSNTANALRPSKDDSVTIKKGEGILEKLAPLQADRRNVSLLRPAQRPLSVATKVQTDSVTSTQVTATLKQPLVENQSAQSTNPVANTRKVLTKKSTAALKDVVRASGIEGPESDLLKSLPPSGPVPPVHRDLQSQYRPQPICEVPETKPSRTKSKNAVNAPSMTGIAEPLIVGLPSGEPTTVRSDGVYIDDRGEVQVYKFSDDLDRSPQHSVYTLGDVVAIPPDIVSKAYTEDTSKRSRTELEIVDSRRILPQPDRSQPPIPLSEPEEYWEEEEDEENYAEEGYVTARSYRSRGENTTNGATTVIFPKVSQKTKKELAAASAWMDAAKAAGDVEDETWDTTMVAEYGDEIFQYMRELEVSKFDSLTEHFVLILLKIKMLPNAHYMDNQAEIQWSMRSVLMDWLVQVHHRFGLLPETLFLCCNYIDRFLSCKVVSLGKLQLVGATAIFIAAKYEEINCPSVQEIVYMVDNGYTVDEILKAERFMLSMLQFELGWPGPMSFLRRISKADDYDLETRTLAKYFLELTIMDERFVGSPPSFLAAGAHCLARMMLKKGPWVSQSFLLLNFLCTNDTQVGRTCLLLQLHLFAAPQCHSTDA